MKRFVCSMLMIVLGVGTAHAAGGGDHFSATQLFEMGDPSTPVPGAATLLRTRHGLELTLNVTELAPGHLYTIWWVLFNKPEKCEAPIPGVSLCGSADVGRPAVKTATIWASSAIADGSGTARFTGKLVRGRVPAGVFVSPSGIGRLTRPTAAEVHVLGVRHPSAAALAPLGELDDASTSPSGGCTVADGCATEFAGIFVP